MPKTVTNVLYQAGLIPSELMASRTAAMAMGKIPKDIADLLTAEQKVNIIRARHKVCKVFQGHLEDFWRKHYDKTIWNIAMKKDPLMAVLVGDAYKSLSRADFNVSHEGNRDLHLLERFIKQIERKEMPTLDTVTWAMMSASSMPSTFISAYEVYTGRTEIDIRPFFPALDFTDVENKYLKTP